MSMGAWLWGLFWFGLHGFGALGMVALWVRYVLAQVARQADPPSCGIGTVVVFLAFFVLSAIGVVSSLASALVVRRRSSLGWKHWRVRKYLWLAIVYAAPPLVIMVLAMLT
jgi:hypothetical protein